MVSFLCAADWSALLKGTKMNDSLNDLPPEVRKIFRDASRLFASKLKSVRPPKISQPAKMVPIEREHDDGESGLEAIKKGSSD